MEGVSCPVAEALVSSGKWEQAPPREAVPLPLAVVAKLELALKGKSAEDAWLLGAILFNGLGRLEMVRCSKTAILITSC